MSTAEQLSRFAACLWVAGDLIELRHISRGGGQPIRDFWHAVHATQALTVWCNRWNQTHDVYAGINPRKRTGGKAEDVAMARCLFVDFDDTPLASAADRIDAAGLPVPTCVVWSGGGPHCYWRLAEPMKDLETWSDLQKRLIQLLGTDRVVHDAPRIMRLPGFTNHKPGRSASELILAEPHSRHEVKAIVARLPSLVAERKPEPVSVRRTWLPTNREKIVKRAAAYVERIPGAIAGQHGHNRTFRVACVLAQRFGLTRDEALPILAEFNARCDPPWREKDLERKYEQARGHKTRTRVPA